MHPAFALPTALPFSPTITTSLPARCPVRSARPTVNRRTHLGPPPTTATATSEPTTDCTPSSLTATSFGRGQQYPRRFVGLYELSRADIDPTTLVAESKRNETAFATVIGLITVPLVVLPVLAPTLPIEAPLAGAAGTFMTAWAVDTLALQGVGARALAMQFSGRARIAAHEAGHFLVGHLLGFPVESYAVPSPVSVLRGETGGVAFGVSVARGDAFRVAATGLAGIAGEIVETGSSEGGAADLGDVARGIRACERGRVPDERLQSVVRWGIIEAVQLLRQHRKAHQELAAAMLDGRSVEECVATVEQFVQRDALMVEAGVGAVADSFSDV